MNRYNKGFALISAIIIAFLVAGGVTAGVVINKNNQEQKIEKGDDQPTYTVPRETEVEALSSTQTKPAGFNCQESLCVEAGKLNVGIYQTEYRVDVAQYKLTNGTGEKISVDKLIFTHPSSYNFNGLLSLNFALNVNGKQVGSAPAFVNRGNHYDLTFLKGNGQFDSFMMAPYETVEISLQNSVSPFSTGGSVEIFLSEIEASNNIKFSGNISGGKIPVADVVGKSDCQEKFGTMKNPSTGQVQPVRVHLLSPNSGKFDQGDNITIKWETCDLPPEGQLFRAYLGGQPIVSEGPEAVNDGIQVVKIPNNFLDGSFSLSIEVLDMYHGGGDYITFDDSDGLIVVGETEESAPIEEPDQEDEEEMTDVQKDVNARANLSSFRAAAEVTFDQNYGSYDNVCDEGNIAYELFREARKTVGMSKDNDCKENGSNYRVWLQMITTSSVFCVDNTGHNALVSKSSVNNNSYRCSQ